MIDLKDFRTNPQKYITWAVNKWHSIDWDRFTSLESEVRSLKTQIDELNWKRNKLSASIQSLDKWSEEFQQVVKQVQELKWTLSDLEEKHKIVDSEFTTLYYTIPSPAFDEVPVGKSDEENIVLAELWEKRDFWFEPKTHWELLEAKGLLDQERAVKISWSRFQIVRWKFAQLQFWLIQRAIKKLTDKWFNLALVPQLVLEHAMFATWYLPNEGKNLYRVNPKLEGADQEEWEEDDLWLIGTSEVPLIAQHAWETFDANELPLRYVWFSSCYRREAGTYGKDTKWLIRLHQFEKVEMVSFVPPEKSSEEHELLREIEEEIFTDLWVPFQRIDICTGDLGAPAAKKYDLEAWFPGIGKYVEVTSTSNTTDFQTRRAQVKFKDGQTKDFVHSLNGTAVALWRALAAIVENYQTEEGDIRVPEALIPYVGFDVF